MTVRDIPLILAAAYKAQRNLKQIAQTVLQSSHDNPLWIPKDQAAKVGAEPYVCSNGELPQPNRYECPGRNRQKLR